MAATIATTMAMINAKCLNTTASPKFPKLTPSKPNPSLLSLQSLPKSPESSNNLSSISITSSAIAGAVFSTLGASDAAFAAQQIAEIAEGSDNRGLALLLPIIPAIAWVLFNILQPALNQINKMRNTKGVIVGLGLGGGLAGMVSPSEALAAEVSMIADAAAAAGSDGRGQLLLLVVSPAIVWVLYNILQPALNQINRMRSQ